MQIIYFEENKKNKWNEFIAENCSESFLQSWEWGKFQKTLGRKIWRVGIVEDNLASENKTDKFQIQNPPHEADQPWAGKYQINSKFLATALIVKHDLPFGKSYLYCPRGMVMEKRKTKNEKRKIMDLSFNEIKKIAKKENSLFLRIDPLMELNDEFGIMNYEYSFNFKKSPNEIQPRDTLILDLTKSEEELLREMKQKTRYNIRLAEKKGIKITNFEFGTCLPVGKVLNLENFKKGFEEFWELVEETSARDKFISHNKSYYWKMLESLGESKDDIPKCRLRARLYLAEYDNKTIAANIVLYFGDLSVYLHGASSNEHRNVMAPYLLQWRQILDAKKMGYKKYDFWGIAFLKSQIPNPKSQINSKFQNQNKKKFNPEHSEQNSKFQSWGGITRFKKGFGGEEKNYIGAYDLVFDNVGYEIYKFVKFIKYLVLRVC